MLSTDRNWQGITRLEAFARERGTAVDALAIARLTGQVAMLTTRAADRDTTIADLTAFKTAALSRLAAQHQEITRLRRAPAGNLRHLPDRTSATSPSS